MKKNRLKLEIFIVETTSKFRSFRNILWTLGKLAGLKAFLGLHAERNGPIAWRENESRKKGKEWIVPCYLWLRFSVVRRACLFDISGTLMKRGGDLMHRRIIACGYSRYRRIASFQPNCAAYIFYFRHGCTILYISFLFSPDRACILHTYVVEKYNTVSSRHEFPQPVDPGVSHALRAAFDIHWNFRDSVIRIRNFRLRAVRRRRIIFSDFTCALSIGCT